MAKLDIYSTNWTEIIFENKNKIYGAYNLRKRYAKNLELACILAIAFITFLVIAPKIFERLSGQKLSAIITVSDPILFSEIIKKIELPVINKAPIPASIPTSKTDKVNSPQIVEVLLVENVEVADVTSLLDVKPKDGTLTQISGADFGLEGDLISEPFEEFGNKGKPASIVEIMPSFPGGEIALSLFLSSNINYPSIELENGIQGKVYMTFVVDKDGKIINITILREVAGGQGLTKEATRVIASMPKWNPGKQNGQAVPVQFNLPINFSIGKN